MCNCGNCNTVTELRQEYEKRTGNKWDRNGGRFFRSDHDPYIRFLEEELIKKEKAQQDNLNKVIDNDL